jgi:hypothetical protein
MGEETCIFGNVKAPGGNISHLVLFPCKGCHGIGSGLALPLDGCEAADKAASHEGLGPVCHASRPGDGQSVVGERPRAFVLHVDKLLEDHVMEQYSCHF